MKKKFCCLTGLLVAAGLLFFDTATSAEFGVSAASYLGDAGDNDAVKGVRIALDGTVVLAANLGTAQPGGGAPVLLNGATTNSAGAIVRLAADGQTVLSVTRFASEVRDLVLDFADNIYVAAGTNGVFKLNAAASTISYQRLAGSFVHRVDVSASGRMVCLVPTTTGSADDSPGAGTLYHYDAAGTLVASWAGKNNTLDVCLDEVSQTIIYIGFRQASAWGPPGDTQGYLPVQIAYVRGADYSGNAMWTAYDWDARTGYNSATDSFDDAANDALPTGVALTKYRTNFLNRYDNNMADTRGLRCAMGRDGQLYLAFECAGGNHIFRDSPSDLAANGSVVGGDFFHQFVNTGASHKTYIGRYDPASGAVLRGQQFATIIRTGSGPSANTMRMKAGDLTADEQGRVIFGGESAYGLPMWPNEYYAPAAGQETFNPFGKDDYLGGAYFFVMSSNLATRLYVTRLATSGRTHAVDARILAGATNAAIAFGGQASLGSGPIFTKNAPQSVPGYGANDGFFAVLGGDNNLVGNGGARHTFTYGDAAYSGGVLKAIRGGAPTNTNLIDLDGDGPDDSLQFYAYSESNPLTPTNGWTGQRIFGGFYNLTFNGPSEQFDEYHFGNADLDIRIMPNAGQLAAQHGVFYFDKADFGLDPTNKLSFDRASKVYCNANFGRWLVRQRGVFYVSEKLITDDHTLAFDHDLDDGRWAVWQPGAPLDFNAATALFATRNFDDLDAVGFVVDVDTASASTFWLQFNKLTADFAVNHTDDAPPVAIFTRTPNVGGYALDVAVDATASSDDAGVSFFAWNFGNGTVSSGPVEANTYGAAGAYDITLRVWDAPLQTASTTRRVWAVLTNTPPAQVTNVVAAFGGSTGNNPFQRVVATSGHDFDGDGPDDWVKEIVFDETQPFTGGRGTKWHGGLRVEAQNANPNFDDAGVNGDWNWRSQPSAPIRMYAAVFVDKGQFLNRADARPATFANGSFLRITNVTFFDQLGQPRWLVRDGTNYFASERLISNNTAGLRFNFTNNTDHGRWAEWNPRTSVNFDQSNAVFATRTFTNVTGAGFIIDNDNWNASRHWLDFGKFECVGSIAQNSAPPVAVISAPGTVGTLQAIVLDGGASTSSGRITSYAWNLGDGSTATGATVPFLYTDPGAKNVTLTVTDDLGQSHTTGTTINVVANNPPEPAFTATPTNGEIPLLVSFDAAGSTDDHGIASYAWDFNNDGVFDATGVSVGHTFTAAFLHTVTLRVTDIYGLSATTSAVIRATQNGQIPPVARFSMTPSNGFAPLQVAFNASASSDSDGSITNTAWDFGADGTNDFTGVSVGRNFVTPGVFAARVTVTDNAGLSASATQFLTVSATSGPPAIIYWGGDSVTSGRNFRSVSPTSQNQQDFDGDAANDDTALGWAFSTTNRLSPTNGYFGQPFHGGIRGQVLNATNSNYGDSGIANNANFKDTINQRLQLGASQPSRWHWCVYWDKRDFYNGGAASNAVVRFDTNSSLRMFGINSLENAGTLRWLVRDGGQFYVSEHPLTNSSGTARYTNFTAATDGHWAAYDPASDLNFDQTNASFAPRKFTDITAAGFIVDQDAFDAVRHWIIFENFVMRATVLPPTGPAPTITHEPLIGRITLRWPDTGTALQLRATPSLAPPVTWTTVIGAPVLDNGVWSWSTPTPAFPVFFRLEAP